MTAGPGELQGGNEIRGSKDHREARWPHAGQSAPSLVAQPHNRSFLSEPHPTRGSFPHSPTPQVISFLTTCSFPQSI